MLLCPSTLLVDGCMITSHCPGVDTSRLLLATLRCEISLGAESLDPIWRVIAWSLNAPSFQELKTFLVIDDDFL